MKKKRYDTSELDEHLEILNAHDYSIIQLSPYHYRINGRLDIWPTSRKAYDIRAQGHGDWSDGDLVGFVFDWLPRECGVAA